MTIHAIQAPTLPCRILALPHSYRSRPDPRLLSPHPCLLVSTPGQTHRQSCSFPDIAPVPQDKTRPHPVLNALVETRASTKQTRRATTAPCVLLKWREICACSSRFVTHSASFVTDLASP